MTEAGADDSTPEDALAYAKALSTDGDARVTLFANTLDGAFRPFTLNPSSTVTAAFREAAAAFASALSQRTLVAYAPGRQPDTNELPWYSRDDVPELLGVVDRAETDEPLELFDTKLKDAKKLRLLVLSIRGLQGWVHFIRKTTLRVKLQRSRLIAVVMREGFYDRFESDVLLFDRSFDALIAHGLVFMANQLQFERGVGFLDRAGAAARATLESVTAKLRIDNVDKLLEAASSDTNMIAKVRGIQAKMSANPTYVDAMTMTNVLSFIRSHPHVGVSLEGPPGQEKLVYEPEPAHRWRILKLLDDDYLHSELTAMDYEANSKDSGSTG